MKDFTEHNYFLLLILQYTYQNRSFRYVDLLISLNSERNPSYRYSKNDFATGRLSGYGGAPVSFVICCADLLPVEATVAADLVLGEYLAVALRRFFPFHAFDAVITLFSLDLIDDIEDFF